MSACTPEPKDEKKTVSFTGAETSVTVNSAILTAYANLPADVTGDVIMGVVYSTSSSPDFQNGRILTSKELDENNMYQIEVTDLTPNTKYYYKSFLSYSDQTYYGGVKEFTTVQVLASVSTLEAWDVTETKARLGGIVSVFSTGNVKREAAIYYGTDDSDIEVLKTKGSRIGIDEISEDGVFAVNLDALTAFTKYYYVAIVLVEGVEFVGAIKNFTTQDRPTGISVTGESSDIGGSSAKLYGWCNQEEAEGTSVVFGIEYSSTDLTTAANTIIASEKDAENKYCCQATGLSSNTLYYYRAFTLFNGVRSYGEVKTFTTLAPNCPSGAVDLGLSVYWATCNLCESGFVSSPEQYGDYYAWGETAPKDEYYNSTYKWYIMDYGWVQTITKYNTYSSWGTVDYKSTLDPEDDVAHVKLGGSWRMPKLTEWRELLSNCTQNWTDNYNGTGIAGMVVTSNVEGYKNKSIFLPAAGSRLGTDLFSDELNPRTGDPRTGAGGHYWSSSLYTENPEDAWKIDFRSGQSGPGQGRTQQRYYGFSVRPVSE